MSYILCFINIINNLIEKSNTNIVNIVCVIQLQCIIIFVYKFIKNNRKNKSINLNMRNTIINLGNLFINEFTERENIIKEQCFMFNDYYVIFNRINKNNIKQINSFLFDEHYERTIMIENHFFNELPIISNI